MTNTFDAKMQLNKPYFTKYPAKRLARPELTRVTAGII